MYERCDVYGVDEIEITPSELGMHGVRGHATFK